MSYKAEQARLEANKVLLAAQKEKDEASELLFNGIIHTVKRLSKLGKVYARFDISQVYASNIRGDINAIHDNCLWFQRSELDHNVILTWANQNWLISELRSLKYRVRRNWFFFGNILIIRW